MRRVDYAELEMSIYIQLRVLRGTTRTNLQRINSDQACQTAARLIIERCLSGCAIFKPSPFYRFHEARFGEGAGHKESQGKFGESEPWPRPPQPPPTLDRCRLCTANDVDGMGEELARVMWQTLNPQHSFDDAGDHRTSFLLMAHRTINWLGRAHYGDLG